MNEDTFWKDLKGLFDNYNPIYKNDQQEMEKFDQVCDLVNSIFRGKEDQIISAEANKNPDFFFKGLIKVVLPELTIEEEHMDELIKAIELSDNVSICKEGDAVSLAFFVNNIWSVEGVVQK